MTAPNYCDKCWNRYGKTARRLVIHSHVVTRPHNNPVYLTPNMNVTLGADPGFHPNVRPLRALGSLGKAQVTQSYTPTTSC